MLLLLLLVRSVRQKVGWNETIWHGRSEAFVDAQWITELSLFSDLKPVSSSLISGVWMNMSVRFIDQMLSSYVANINCLL